MPYPVQYLIVGRGEPVSVHKEDSVQQALNWMIEYDFSQLPVVDAANRPVGMVTHEGILRGMRNFKARLDDLRVRDVMVTAPKKYLEDDLFDLLDLLKQTNAVLIVDPLDKLVGIVTSYDSTEYFRSRTEDLMRVEDIESMVKDFITYAYAQDNGDPDQARLASTVNRIFEHDRFQSRTDETDAIKKFDDLTLGEYIYLLALKDTWNIFEPIFKISRESVRELLDSVRRIRNTLAHFRGDITPEERDQLRFCMEWLTRCNEEYLASRKVARQKYETAQTRTPEKSETVPSVETSRLPAQPAQKTGGRGPKGRQKARQPASEEIHSLPDEDAPASSRYAPLSNHLQSLPGKTQEVQLTFKEMEEIIGGPLPNSARNHRSWWANDSVGHNNSTLWLDVGWRTTDINMSEGRVTFNRIREREKAHIDFFSALLTELRKKPDLPVRNVSPDGVNWIVINGLPEKGRPMIQFSFSFSRGKHFRVEMVIDAYEKEKTKKIFDRLFAQREDLEAGLGPVSWERINDRRASRIALYHPGQITDSEPELAALREWAQDAMVRFYAAFAKRAEKALLDVRKSPPSRRGNS